MVAIMNPLTNWRVLDSAGVEGSIFAELLGGEMQALMDQYRAQGADQFKGLEQCYNPAPASPLQLNQPHSVMPSAASGVGSAAADAAACEDSATSHAATAPESAEDVAQKQYQRIECIV